MASDDFDIAIQRVAHRHAGLFSNRHIAALGGTPKMTEVRVRTGRWNRLARGVFTLAGFPNSWERSLWLPLMVNPRGLVSGAAAAGWYSLTDFGRSRPEVTVPRGSNHRLPLAMVHQSDLTLRSTHRGVPIVTPAQVFIDLAGRVSRRKLVAAFEDAVRDGLLDPRELVARFAELHDGRLCGADDLRYLVRTYGSEGATVPASELERSLYSVLDRPGMPTYAKQAKAPWWEPGSRDTVDADLPGPAIIVEADGRRWHTRERDFVNDRRRDTRAASHGRRVMRLCYADLVHRPDSCADAIIEAARYRLHRIR